MRDRDHTAVLIWYFLLFSIIFVAWLDIDSIPIKIIKRANEVLTYWEIGVRKSSRWLTRKFFITNLRSRRLKGNFKRGSVTLITTISLHSISQYIIEIKNLGLGYSQDVYLKRWMCAKLVNRISYAWLYKIQSNRNFTDLLKLEVEIMCE